MKHYRLKKDLPTFKAGQTFHMTADGNLWLDEGQDGDHWKDEVMAYNHRTIEHFPNILEEWFEEIVVPSPGYTVAMIQKLENSVKALDERLKAIEKDVKPTTPAERNKDILIEMPKWSIGDSANIDQIIKDEAPADKFDMIMSCPPYADLEVYSDDPADINPKSAHPDIYNHEPLTEKDLEACDEISRAVKRWAKKYTEPGSNANGVSEAYKAYLAHLYTPQGQLVTKLMEQINKEAE